MSKKRRTEQQENDQDNHSSISTSVSISISKSQRKREMEHLQVLGEALVKLDPSSLAHFSMPDTLREAILEAQHIKAHGGLRRQLQYIGKLMRDVDAQLLQQQLHAYQDGSQTRKRYDNKIEQWRERLLQDSTGLETLMQEFPQLDRQQLSMLIEQARVEIKANQQAAIHDTHHTPLTPPVAFRKLYRMLKELMPFSLL